MKKRKVTADDLLNHPQLGEQGVKEGDEHSFNADGFPVSDEDAGTAGADASGEGADREITEEDLVKYPALSNAGAIVGDVWSFDTGNGDPIFPEPSGIVKRLITEEDLVKFPGLAEKGLTIEHEQEFDAEGNPVFAADAGEDDGA